MTDIEPHLQRLGLSQYYDVLVTEGFDTWESVLDIQEGDLESLHVRLGHRRKLQRAIAEYRGLASDRPLGSPTQDSTLGGEGAKVDTTSHASGGRENTTTTSNDQKRRYRRHPKPDEHAPEKPPSAYVLFSNRVREEVKSENLSFTDIARLVGERWQKLNPAQKERFDSHATRLKDTYNAQLSEYKKTEAFREYTQYLADFKAKQTITSEVKRPKLDQHYSSSLSAASAGSVGESQLSQTPRHTNSGSIDSSSTISAPGQLPMTSLQLLTPANITSSAIGTGSLMNQTLQERRMLESISAQRFKTEDNPSSRFDQVDEACRTTGPSSNTPPACTPPSPLTSSRLHRRDYGSGSRTQHWSNRSASFPYESLTTLEITQTSVDSAIPASKMAAGQWQDRSAESRSRYTSAASQPSQQSNSVPISQLVSSVYSQDSGLAAGRGTLPPLRQSASTPSNFPSNLFGGQPAATAAKMFHHNSDITPLRHGQSHMLPDQSESEAATTLTELAERSIVPDHQRRFYPFHDQRR